MRKNNGFTLVELMAVIVVLGLLITIAIPSSIKLSEKVKNKTYKTKIELIEAAAKNYGQSNVTFVKRGTDLLNQDRHYTCKLNFDEDGYLSSIKYNYQTAGYDETKALGENEYWCSKVSVEDLVKTNNLSWDETDKCNGLCHNDNEVEAYDNRVINPVSNFIINKCNIYMYSKNNRVYAVFDRPTCDVQSNVISDGHEYRPLK